MTLCQQLHILLRHVDAVRRRRRNVEQMMAVQYLRGREPVALEAVVVLLFCLRQMQLHLQTV